MAQKTLILGDSGTGKSASLRYFKDNEVLVINCANKPLPFKNHFETATPSFEKLTRDVLQAMENTKKKIIVVDDAQYIMSFQYMRRIKESGWDKWNDIQGDFFNIIKKVDDLPADVTVYFLSHLQRDDEGHEKIKTMGKMLDEKITIEGLFTTVLKTSVKDGQYFFLTQNSGLDTVKSPIGMFPSYAIDNDLKYVDEKIRNYYEIGDYVPDEVIAAADQEAAKPEIEKPAADGRRRRRSSTTNTTADTTAEPVKYTRKERNGTNKEEKPEEASAEEKKEETDPAEWTGAKAAFDKAKRRRKRVTAQEGAEEASDESDTETPSEPKKRTRRRKNSVTADDFMNIPEDISDDEVPFN